ncbi:MAG: FAD:protein FMN transferase [Clostridia bacterium]|nr:FAD:protein FMN transferase [Clostridia bacterium]
MKISYLLAPLICVIVLAGCGRNTADSAEFSKAVFAMDTEMTLKAYGANSESAVNAAEREINRLDRLFDRGRDGSDINKVNAEGTAKVSSDTSALTETALDVCEATDGAFDITIAPVMDLWGFYTGEYQVPDDDELAKAMAKVDRAKVNVDGEVVSVKDGAKLDLGGIAKGYLSARIMEIFRENGVESGIVSLGGNVQALGLKPDGSKWRVAIQDPRETDMFIGSVSISDKAVITSGGYQRYFEDGGNIYHHIIDPSTGYPAESGLSSVSIISEDGATADGLSTALFVMGLDKGSDFWRAHNGFDVIFVTGDGEIYVTDGLSGVFESERKYTVIKR